MLHSLMLDKGHVFLNGLTSQMLHKPTVRLVSDLLQQQISL